MDVMQLHVDFNFCAIKINVLPHMFFSHVVACGYTYSMFLTPVVTCLYLLSCGHMHLPHHSSPVVTVATLFPCLPFFCGQ